MGVVTRRRASCMVHDGKPQKPALGPDTGSLLLQGSNVQDGKPQPSLDPDDLRSSLLQGSNEPHDTQCASRPWFSEEREDDGLALPSLHSKWLYRCSHLCVLTALLAASLGKWDLFMIPFGAGITSINYWRRPDYGWRRYVDIVCIQLCVYWNLVRAVDVSEPARTLFFVTEAAAILSFAPAMYYCRRPADGNWTRFLQHEHADARSLCLSTFWHSLVHVLGNLANVILYLSDVPALSAAWFVPLLFVESGTSATV
ncbi:hypothetical protein T484DRAFT_1934257 [Baffinella frigidus]|nr:hypothetical protein T484DRAFT_1934257 [Cryptophyta sp. CCMP2293]